MCACALLVAGVSAYVGVPVEGIGRAELCPTLRVACRGAYLVSAGTPHWHCFLLTEPLHGRHSPSHLHASPATITHHASLEVRGFRLIC